MLIFSHCESFPTLFNNLKSILQMLLTLKAPRLCCVLDYGNTLLCMIVCDSSAQKSASAALKSSILFHVSGSLARNPTNMPSVTNTFLFHFVKKSTRVFCYAITKSTSKCFNGSCASFSVDAFSMACSCVQVHLRIKKAEKNQIIGKIP